MHLCKCCVATESRRKSSRPSIDMISCLDDRLCRLNMSLMREECTETTCKRHKFEALRPKSYKLGWSRKFKVTDTIFFGLCVTFIALPFLAEKTQATYISEFQRRLNSLYSDSQERHIRSLPNDTVTSTENSVDRDTTTSLPTNTTISPQTTGPDETVLDDGSYYDDEYSLSYNDKDYMTSIAEKFYRGPVCALMDVRNDPIYLRDLENCTVINGFLQITFMPNAVESDFDQYSFPKLRVITEYLLIYRVYGLRSLKKLFPNLAVIRGRQIFDTYGLVIYENPQFQEIGLENLRLIKRGGVRIQYNNKLCYLGTIDWARLRPSEVIIKDNALSDDETCLDQCSEDGRCVDHQGSVEEHCWGHKVCQKPSCPDECPDACEDGKCVCHEECLGGCLEHSNASACRACLHVNHEGKCLKECPKDTYLESGWRCLTKEECWDLGWALHTHYHERGEKIYKCVFSCPSNHILVTNDHELHCKPCVPKCEKVCEKDITVTDAVSVKRLHGCTKIPGTLEISRLVGDDTVSLLESALSGLEELGALKVVRTESLVSLSFLKGLKRITGKYLLDGRYSLMVINNVNLHKLFPETNATDGLRIEGGKVFFHFNPKLCMKEIDKVSELTTEEEDDKDISIISNGDRGVCDMLPLDIVGIKHGPKDVSMSTVRIIWNNVRVDDERTLIGYQVFYKESAEKNAKRYEGRNVCGQAGTGWEVKDVPTEMRLTDDNETTTSTVLHHLKPYTQYAFYVMTYTTSSASKGAQSNVTYFTTKPSKPSEPIDTTTKALNSSALKVQWKPPLTPNGIIKFYVVTWHKLLDERGSVEQVDTCQLETPDFPMKKSSTPPKRTNPSTEPPSNSGNKKCCTCDEAKIDRAMEEEAINNVKFENHLHRNLISMSFGSAEGYRRKRRSLNEDDSSSLDDTGAYERGYYNVDDRDEYGDADVEDEYLRLPDSLYYIDIDDTHASEKVNGTEIILTGLHHFTTYVVQVYACNHAAQFINGSRMTSDYCSNYAMNAKRTDFRQDVDDIPDSSLQVYEEQLEDGRQQPILAWKPPTNPNGYIKYYEIEIQADSQYEGSDVSRHVNCYSVQSYKRDGGKYKFQTVYAAGPHSARIRAASLAQKGNWTRYLSFDIPQSPAERERVRAQNLQIGIAIGISFIIIIIISAIFSYKMKKKKDGGTVLYTSNPEYASMSATYISDEYEIEKENVELVKVIGNGNFGKVYLGYAKNVIKGEERTQVAVKKLHESSGMHRRVEFLEEAKLMKAFNATHVVRLLGVVSRTPDPMVIMEYMERGDLKSYLRSRREDAEHPSEDNPAPLTLQDKLEMAAEIADGMAYLVDIKYVHRDLAARNCLVSSDRVVKIGDFGLARDVYETDYYRKDSRGMLPIRWMAPESLRDGVFNFQTDVWSFGVVLWEIATLAQQPYQGRPHDDVTRFVIDGGYMERPKNCPKKLYDLMLCCWEYNPDMRPKFTEILTSLSNDVNERFKIDSYYFEQKTKLEQASRLEEDMLFFSGDDGMREEPFRMMNPWNGTPTRSKCDTPSGYHTPSSRHSNSSAKLGTDCLAHFDHLKRIDVSALNGSNSNAKGSSLKYSGSLKNSSSLKGSGPIRKTESFNRKLPKNPFSRQNNQSSNAVRKIGDDVYYSVSTGTSGIEEDFDGTSSEDSISQEQISIIESSTTDQQQDNCSVSEEKSDALSATRPVLSENYENSKSLPDSEKPYALMNGFVKRLDSASKRLSPLRLSNKRKRSANDESSYVESSPQNSAKYFESKGFKSPIERFIEAPPPPPTSPPPLPPANV